MLRQLYRSAVVRFAVVGAAMTGLHLLVFTALSRWVLAEVANVGAFVLVTQANFVVSRYWTWADRRPSGPSSWRALLRAVVLFNGSAVLAFGVNAVSFSVALRVVGLGPTVSVLLASLVAAGSSFVVSSRVVFRRPVPALSVPVASPAPAAPSLQR
ncbi:GtrA family protein [Klenkia sp. LSe6-5]|uniref:GtrA family protein n=1 Tax=Klenkia sesuvii TaxID=3103137 RepID=A0ABU8DR95_9ACTN